MKIFNEDEILNPAFRAQVIKEIRSGENQARKREMMKRQEVYRDNVIKWVMTALESMKLRPETLQMMKNHAANISIAKKIVNKKARCYRGSVMRQTGQEQADAQITALAALMMTDSVMKKADRFAVLMKNALPWVFPEMLPDGKWRLKSVVLSSSQYDVIENGRDPEKPACVVLSDYVDENTSAVMSTPGGGWRSTEQASTRLEETLIGDGPQSQLYKPKQYFIWWTDKYHFTSDEKGTIVPSASPEDLLNPIGMIPGAPVAEDQDGHYWAAGGEDLVDGSILVNMMITDMLSIMYLQGHGQLVITGANIPEEYQVGPNVALVLKTKSGEDQPNVQLVAHNPPIDSWLRTIEQYVALLLSTNDLAPSSVATRLDAANMASGIAMLIEKSEAQGSIDDRRQVFAQAERRYWEAAKRWQNLYYDLGSLDEEFSAVGQIADDAHVTVRFNDAREVTTEKERLETMKLRRDMGLATHLDIVMMDNPSMTKEEAQMKLAEIQADASVAAAAMAQMVDQEMRRRQEQEPTEPEEEDETEM